MKKSIYIVLFLLAGRLWGQTITPQVLNSAGGDRKISVGSDDYFITDNVGEPFTATISKDSVMITQGFIQPPIYDGVTIIFKGLTCIGSDDGMISVAYSSLNTKHTEQYIWSPGGACP